MPLAEARALAFQSATHFELHDPQADHQALRKLTAWCQRFSPRVALDEAEQPDSLLLDVTGCGPLFHGEEKLAEKTAREFRRGGYAATVAIADTIGVAWAVAHTLHVRERATCIVPPGEQSEVLCRLGIECLRLSAQAVELLHVFDIRRVGQLLTLPRAQLSARFKQEVVQRLDQALGNIPELLTPEGFEEPVEASWLFEPPTGDRRSIEAVLGKLLEQVLERLQPRRQGVQRLLCSLQTSGQEPVHVAIGLLKPSTSPGYLMEMMRLHFERMRIPAEVSSIDLRVTAAAPLELHQEHLFEEEKDRGKDFAALIERLSNRLGEQAVLRPMLWPDAQPELAYRCEPWLRSERTRSELRALPTVTRPGPLLRPTCLTSKPRPISVMSVIPGGPPLRFQWKGQNHLIAHYWGPERIETGWWREQDVHRDYYLVETTLGKRFWLFRTMRDERWFLHGLFS